MYKHIYSFSCRLI